MAVVSVAGNDLIAILERHLHADDNSFLPDIKMAEAADEAHTVELTGLFLEAADKQHLAIGFKFGGFVEVGNSAIQPAFFSRFLAGCGCGRFTWRHVILPVVMLCRP